MRGMAKEPDAVYAQLEALANRLRKQIAASEELIRLSKEHLAEVQRQLAQNRESKNHDAE